MQFLLVFIVWCVFFIIIFHTSRGQLLTNKYLLPYTAERSFEFVGDLNTVTGNKSGNLSLGTFALCLLNVNYSFFHFSLSLKFIQIKHLEFFWGVKSYGDWERREFVPQTVCTLTSS